MRSRAISIRLYRSNGFEYACIYAANIHIGNINVHILYVPPSSISLPPAEGSFRNGPMTVIEFRDYPVVVVVVVTTQYNFLSFFFLFLCNFYVSSHLVLFIINIICIIIIIVLQATWLITFNVAFCIKIIITKLKNAFSNKINKYIF